MKPILEINPQHSLVQKLQGSAQFDDLANVMFDQALIAEGGLPENPAEYLKRINSLLLKETHQIPCCVMFFDARLYC